MNLVIVQGAVARAPEEWVVATGDRIVGFDVAVRREGEAAEVVPIRWEAPPTWASDLAAGDELLVTGRVRRRFFRAGGGTQSRTEVLVGSVVRVRSGRRGRRAVEEAIAAALAGAGIDVAATGDGEGST
jgi:single-strand DNA-binding protein